MTPQVGDIGEDTAGGHALRGASPFLDLSRSGWARYQGTARARIITQAIGLGGAGFTLWVMATADPSLRLPTVVAVGVSLGLWAAGR